MERDNFNILTDEELVKMAQEGSATAAEFLISKYKEMARRKAGAYYIIGGDREDVIQEGMIGIFKAIRCLLYTSREDALRVTAPEVRDTLSRASLIPTESEMTWITKEELSPWQEPCIRIRPVLSFS